MPSINELTLAQPSQWFLIETSTTTAKTSTLPKSFERFVVFFSDSYAQLPVNRLIDLLAQELSAPFYICQYQAEECLPLALAIALDKSDSLSKSQIRDIAAQFDVQGAILEKPPTLDNPGLLVMDMDSTAIQIECIDEIARLAGRYDEVASVTAQAMAGELSFAESLHRRVKSLAGVPLSQIQGLKDSLPLMPGIQALCQVLKQHGWHLAIASGGFTWFAEALIEPLQLNDVFANTLEVKNDQLTGNVLGDVVDANKKAQVLVQLAEKYHIPAEQTVAIGDGANDLVMMSKAQLGVAVHGKPKVVEQADAAICRGSLLQLVYLLQLPRQV
ncbi:phosphoserine phosphatase SerB [Pseudoalteromonas sp. T1lg65]|uniref:phosphoserine phosphatase SerB n=1 Tax=Pseudoalteromonas sp. T1lg65 TaxID=2077101 RepID=UPI003F7AFD8C